MIAAMLAAVLAVYPSGPVVPEALLRVTIVFDRPQQAARAGAVTLRHQDGSAIAHAFADPPLWSPDGESVTLLLDPSRQKLGLARHDRLGFVLRGGDRVTLNVDGVPRHAWRVRSGSCPALDPRRWKVSAPRPGSREALVVRFGAPVDTVSSGGIAIADARGARVAGAGRLRDGERGWTFVPARAWRHGMRLAIHPRFEDPCGNEIGEAFEHAPAAGLAGRGATAFVPIPGLT